MTGEQRNGNCMLRRGSYYEGNMISLPITTLENDHARLEPLAEPHREALRAACNADADIWEIYPYSMRDPHFDEYWQNAMQWQAEGARQIYAVIVDSVTIGTSSYYTLPDLPADSVSIGGTYYAPAFRGGTVNPAAKLLMMEHAFANGMAEVYYHVDTRNQRSQAAVLKLGAKSTRIIQKDKTTWTGYLRDSAEFVIDVDDWPAVRAGLVLRMRV